MKNAAAMDPAQSTPIRCEINLTFTHSVHFTENLFHPDNPLLASLFAPATPLPGALVVLDAGLHRARPELQPAIAGAFARINRGVRLVAAPILMEGGELLKNSASPVTEIQAAINRHNLDRHSYIVAIGGGALLDVAGFAAATAHRGLRHIRVPSTTLSQADSGVGVKNGINAFGKKNFVGAFAVPSAVIIDFALLDSLPARDKLSGFSEAVKVAAIRNVSFFDWIERNAGHLRGFDPKAMRQLVHRSAQLHVNHIARGGDPFELASARPLDFGHWSAHKLEQLTGYEMPHGHAVAIGIALDVIYSRRAKMISDAAAERVLRLLEHLGFELYAKELSMPDHSGGLIILEGLEEFRLHLGGQLTLTLLRDIGHGCEVHQMDKTIIAAAIQELEARHKRRGGHGVSRK